MSSFLQRYGSAFGGPQALLLRMAGLSEAEATAEGCWITDLAGRRWLDFGSFGLHLLGHRHPRVLEVARAQLDRMGLPSKILGCAEAILCAERLKASFPCPMDGVIFANSGAEAVEGALKIARISTGRRRILALRGSYHGKTDACLAISDTMRRHYEPAAAAGSAFLQPGDLAQAELLLREGDVAAVIAEPVQGEGGILPLDPAYLAGLAELCRRHGSLFIIDEIQTGLGRCGEVWAGATAEIAPDIVVAGKTLGGGLVPVSALVYARRHVRAAALDPIIHASTYAASPFACRIAATVVEIVTERAFLAGVREQGGLARHRLHATLEGVNGVRAIRGRGLMLGIELASPDLAGEVVLEAARHGLLLTFCLSRPSVVRFYPPAVTSLADMELGIGILAEAVRHSAARVSAAPVPATA